MSLFPYIFPALYAETHYRFPFFRFSRYFRRLPEIVIDLPRRCETETLPVLILAKDAHKYPFKFTSPLRLEFKGENGSFKREIPVDTAVIDKQWHYQIADLNIPPGKYMVQAKFSYECAGKKHTAYNHNYTGLPSTPFILNRTDTPLPRPAGFLLGDMHLHSQFTSDHIEFGAPTEAISRASKAIGFDFAAVTDHTYDLDDMPDDYLRSDPDLRKWKQFQREIAEINANPAENHAHIIPGQEITVRNRQSRNVHLLLLGDDKLYPGSGDSAEKWFRTRSEHTIEEILSSKQAVSLTGAAHPSAKVPFLEKLFFSRGRWELADLHPGLNAVQIANGGSDNELRDSAHLWIQSLKSGKRLSIWGGSDAHGNFNHYRQVGLPMWNLLENDKHILGKCFTGVYAPGGIGDLWKGLSEGNTYISNGPGLKLTVDKVFPGGTVESGTKKISLEAVSSEEFGKINACTLIYCEKGNLRRKEIDCGNDYYLRKDIELDLPAGFVLSYIETDKGGYGYSSPVYVLGD